MEFVLINKVEKILDEWVGEDNNCPEEDSDYIVFLKLDWIIKNLKHRTYALDRDSIDFGNGKFLSDSGYDYMQGEYYLIKTFSISAEKAKEIYLKWLDTFEDESNEMGFARGYWI